MLQISPAMGIVCLQLWQTY